MSTAETLDPAAASKPRALFVEVARVAGSGDLVGWRLQSGSDTLLVWADQEHMRGFRAGNVFTPNIGERIDYFPVLTSEDLTKDEEQNAYALEVHAQMDTVASYRAGNTQLLEALMLSLADMAEGTGKDAACDALRAAGMLDEGGALNWPALAKRKEQRWTWREAVTALVKQPAVQAHLLRMDDAPVGDGAQEA